MVVFSHTLNGTYHSKHQHKVEPGKARHQHIALIVTMNQVKKEKGGGPYSPWGDLPQNQL